MRPIVRMLTAELDPCKPAADTDGMKSYTYVTIGGRTFGRSSSVAGASSIGNILVACRIGHTIRPIPAEQVAHLRGMAR